MIYSPHVLPEGVALRATHKGNKSHNHELKAYNRLIFTLTRIPKATQKCIEDKCVYFLFSFFLNNSW